MTTANDEADRIMRLLDIGIAAVRADDGATALMAVKEAYETAERMPRKPSADAIPLPDRSHEKIP